MEKMEQEEYHHEFDEEQKLRNFILADASFYNKFKTEWTEATDKLKQIYEASKLIKTTSRNNEVIRVTSSSVVFK